MNELRIFNSRIFGDIRTVQENGQVLFCGADVAKALGYSNTRDALGRHCRGVVKRDIQTPGGIQTVNVISESDVYRLIAQSKLPTAQAFERWIYEEVLPTIRRHGAYLTPEMIREVIMDPDVIIGLAMKLKTETEAKQKLELKAEEDKPKVVLAEAITASETSILIGELARILMRNGIDVGQNRLFAWMRKNKYLCSARGERRNLPTQRAMNMGLFEIQKRSIEQKNGDIRITRTTKVTGKGQQYFVNKFMEQLGEESA